MQEPQETWVRSLGWEDSLEEGMAAHFSIFAWRIPWTEKPGKLQIEDLKPDLSGGYTFNHVFLCRRKWQPTPVFLPGKFHGQKNLVGYSPWDHKELDTTEHTHPHTYPHTQRPTANIDSGERIKGLQWGSEKIRFVLKRRSHAEALRALLWWSLHPGLPR